MKLQTTVEIPPIRQKLRLQDRVLFAGSCFAENIGEQFVQHKFRSLVNPFGILYNPISIKLMLDVALGAYKMEEADYVVHDELAHSFLHHGSFSHPRPEVLKAKVQQQADQLLRFIQKADYLFISWGTAWVYRYIKTGKIVANCHKIPAKAFDRFRLDEAQITQAYDELIYGLQQINPKLKMVLTVSPVRHLKDTAHGNQLSKAILLLAAERLCAKYKQVQYFPSYELVLDELRDYRFYAEDMTHPNQLAVQYIWQKLLDNWLDAESLGLLKKVEALVRATQHRPINPATEAHQKFVRKTLQKIEQLQKQHPYLKFKNELAALQAQIN